MIVFVASVAAGVRSYWAADCITRTAAARVDSFYADRGKFMIQFDDVEGPPGWSYDRNDVGALPRSIAECADPDGLHLLGVEYSAAAKLLVLPLAWPAALAAIIAAILIRRQTRHDRQKRASS